MKRGVIIFLVVAFFIFCSMMLRPVPILPEEECLVTTGIVLGIFEGGKYDVVFRLEGNPRRFYINRGLENGLDLSTLRKELIGERVTFKYPDHWTPLDPSNSTVHLAKVETETKVIFSELTEWKVLQNE